MDLGLPGGSVVKNPTCQGRRCERFGFDPWIGKIPCRRKLQPTLVFWPGKFHGQRNLVVYGLWGRQESDTTERLTHNTYLDTTHTHIWKQTYD